MKSVAAVLIFGAAVALALDSSEWGQGGGRVSTNCTCGYTNKAGGRIVGGRETLANEYPLIAGITYTGRPNFIFCGGTIITNRHVLTAAHCKPRAERDLSVVLAGHDTRKHHTTTIIDVLKMINHEDYNLRGQTENDVALLVLTKSITFGPYIGPACFPKADLNVVGSQVRVIGWGALYSDGPQPNVLQKVDLDVKPLTACASVYPGITSGQLCTYTLYKDACQGDSGGPVIWRDPSTNRYTVVGVVSYGYGCAEPGAPGVNTAVVAYRSWILKKIALTAPGTSTCQNL